MVTCSFSTNSPRASIHIHGGRGAPTRAAILAPKHGGRGRPSRASIHIHGGRGAPTRAAILAPRHGGRGRPKKILQRGATIVAAGRAKLIIIVTAILVLVGGSCLGTGRFIIAYQNPGYIYTALVHIGKELLNILCPMGINCRGSLGTFHLICYYCN